jgi:hypothetical protein
VPVSPHDASGALTGKNALSRSGNGGKKKRRLSLQKIGALVSNSERRERSRQKGREKESRSRHKDKDKDRIHQEHGELERDLPPVAYSPSPPLSADECESRRREMQRRERARSESPPMDVTPLSRAAKSADFSRQALAARSRGPKSSRRSTRSGAATRPLSSHSGDKSKVARLRDRFRL